jgi:prepilin-type N-terminal cleavage/methylation domain-containing protein
MKSLPTNLSREALARTMNTRAFTLTELMITMAIFAMVVLAMVSLQIFGFKTNALTTSKLQSTRYGLKALDQIQTQVRGANSVLVGNVNGSSFASTGTSGNALQVYPTTNTSSYVRFYLVTNTGTLYELNGATSLTLASNIVNRTLFQTVDCHGNVSSSGQEHYAIRLTLQFAQLAYRIPGNVYDYYTLQTEITPRTQN